jgi:two-component system, response regulator PdtaR
MAIRDRWDDGSVTVVLVEHEPVTRSRISGLLSEAGFEVIEAGRTEEAWTILEARPHIGVLVSDLDAPNGLDSLELARKVHERWPSIGLVIISRHIRHLPPSDVPGNGCFLPRPVPVDTLLREVRVAAHQIAG